MQWGPPHRPQCVQWGSLALNTTQSLATYGTSPPTHGRIPTPASSCTGVLQCCDYCDNPLVKGYLSRTWWVRVFTTSTFINVIHINSRTTQLCGSDNCPRPDFPAILDLNMHHAIAGAYTAQDSVSKTSRHLAQVTTLDAQLDNCCVVLLAGLSPVVSCTVL